MDIIKKYFPNLTPEQQQQFSTMLRLYPEWNEKINVISRKDIENLEVNHILHSMALARFVQFVPGTTVMDLGTGGGFPGIPLAIVSGREVTLVESVGKKASLLNSFTDGLNLAGRVRVYSGRAEQLAQEKPGYFSVITARALSSLPSLMELASPLLCQDGLLVCYKSSDIDEEIEATRAIQEKLAMYLVGKREFMLSDEDTRRSIVVYRKDGEPLVKLPRREGQAQRKPYKK